MPDNDPSTLPDPETPSTPAEEAAPAAPLVTKPSPAISLGTTVLAVLLALAAIVAGYYCLHPSLLTYRTELMMAVWGLGSLALLLAYIGARFRHVGSRESMEPGLGKDPVLWLVLVLVGIGGFLYVSQVRERNAIRDSLGQADPNLLSGLGSHLIVAYPSDGEAMELMSLRAVSGFFFDQRHVEGMTLELFAKRTEELQEFAASLDLPPLLLCTDQEGGLIQKLSPPLEATKSLQEVIAAVDSTDLEAVRAAARQLGEQQGAALRTLGINMNLAPVADLMPDGPVPGDKQSHLEKRAVSKDPAVVAAAVTAYIQGLESKGVRGVLKHFPGLGTVGVDTHSKPGEVTTPVSELRAGAWKPFFDALADEATNPAIMLGHVKVPEVDAERLASYSEKVVDLIHETAPGTVTITDCFSMRPIYAGEGGSARATELALESGVDLVLFAWDGELAWEGLASSLRKIEAGELSVENLKDSTARVFAFREPMWLGEPTPTEAETEPGTDPAAEGTASEPVATPATPESTEPVPTAPMEELPPQMGPPPAPEDLPPLPPEMGPPPAPEDLPQPEVQNMPAPAAP